MSETRAMDDQFDKDIFSAGLETPADDDEVVAQGLTSNKAADQTPGQMLREARLARDYSVADLCGLTMLPKHTVEALEDDDFDALTQPVFVRGYYRKCAKVLDIDAEPLLAAYAAAGGPRAAATPQQPLGTSGASVKVMPADVTPRKRRSFGFFLLILILVVAAIAGYMYWSDSLNKLIGDETGGTDISLSSAFDSLQPETDPEAIADTAGEDKGVSILPDILAADEKADAAAGRDNSGQTSDAGGAATTNAAADATDSTATQAADNARTTVTQPAGSTSTQDSAPTGPVAAGASIDTSEAATHAAADATSADSGNATGSTAAATTTALTIKFDDRSWVNIHDASGEQLLVGIYENTTRTLDGEPPYRLVIGYAPGVSVSYAGHAVDFDMAGNHTARFTVGADNG